MIFIDNLSGTSLHKANFACDETCWKKFDPMSKSPFVCETRG